MPSDTERLEAWYYLPACTAVYQLKLFQGYQSSLENTYSGKHILTVEIRNWKKKILIILNVPKSQTAYFPLFLQLTTFHTIR